MKVKFIKKTREYLAEYEALEDGCIITCSGDHPAFGIVALEDMKIFIKKGQHFMLSKSYVDKNDLEFTV